MAIALATVRALAETAMTSDDAQSSYAGLAAFFNSATQQQITAAFAPAANLLNARQRYLILLCLNSLTRWNGAPGGTAGAPFTGALSDAQRLSLLSGTVNAIVAAEGSGSTGTGSNAMGGNMVAWLSTNVS